MRSKSTVRARSFFRAATAAQTHAWGIALGLGRGEGIALGLLGLISGKTIHLSPCCFAILDDSVAMDDEGRGGGFLIDE